MVVWLRTCTLTHTLTHGLCVVLKVNQISCVRSYLNSVCVWATHSSVSKHNAEGYSRGHMSVIPACDWLRRLNTGVLCVCFLLLRWPQREPVWILTLKCGRKRQLLSPTTQRRPRELLIGCRKTTPPPNIWMVINTLTPGAPGPGTGRNAVASALLPLNTFI